jgi:hypothetical protein
VSLTASSSGSTAGIDVTGAETALLVLGAIVAVRLLLAPYWIHQEQAAAIRKLNARLKSKLTRKQVREQIGQFMERGKRFLVRIHLDGVLPDAEIRAWDDEVKEWLNENLDSSYGARFRNPTTQPQAPMGISSDVLKSAWEGVRFRLDNLHEMLDDFG